MSQIYVTHRNVPTIGRDVDVNLRFDGPRLAFVACYHHGRGAWVFPTSQASITAALDAAGVHPCDR